MTRNQRGKLWDVLWSAVAGIGLLALLAIASLADAQFPLGQKSVNKVFTEGVDDYKKGEYQKAKFCFDEDKARIDELKVVHRPDLLKWIEFNDLALENQMKVGPKNIQKPKENFLPYIDAHVHIWTADTARYPLAAGYKNTDIRPASFTPEQLFKHARPAKVGRIALIQISSYGFDNSYMLDMIAKHPDVFVGTALIDPYNEPEKVMNKMARQGVRAFRIQPKLSKEPIGRWLRPEGFAKMFETGARNNQAMSCLIDPDGLPELERMCTAHPNTPVIIDHLARIGVDGVIRPRDVDALCALAKHKKVMVKVGAFYALGKKKAPYTDLGPMIEKTVKAFGADRCMWESDCPFQVEGGHTYQDSIDLVRARLKFLSDADKDWLLTKTAERFFFAK